MNTKKNYLLEPSFVEASFDANLYDVKVKPLSDFKRSINKALSGAYQGLLLPDVYLDNSNLESYLNLLRKHNLTPVFQLHSCHFEKYKKALLKLDKPFLINFIFKDFKTWDSKIMHSFKHQTFFTFIVSNKYKKFLLKDCLPNWILEKTEIYSPYKTHFLDPFLTPKQLYRFILNNNHIQPSSYNIYDERIAEDIDLEPLTKVFYENKIDHNDIRFSVIIPTYNYKNQVLNTLKYLSQQDYPKNQFEIIVVDDGSSDNTILALKDFALENLECNMKFIYYPRVLARKSGDARFRAGIARNLGVKHSSGKYLAFLDADILTPPHYLRTIEQDHKKSDAVLLQRYHLKPNFSLKNFIFNDDILQLHSYVEDKKYWLSFYRQGFDKQKAPWKYVCTYGFSLLKKDFIDVGRFGKVFLYYGFEDTDLGYRLHKKNKSLYLSSLKVYHQPAPQERHEYRKNLFRRYKLLCKTGTIFFYRHLDPFIYQELRMFIKQTKSLHYFFSWKIKNKR